jgi:urocanate hydratase
MKYLSEMTDEQTLVMYSGHPLGYVSCASNKSRTMVELSLECACVHSRRLFPSSKESPRVVITNGMVIPNYSSKDLYEKMHAQGVTMYGQMTAGSYCCTCPFHFPPSPSLHS